MKITLRSLFADTAVIAALLAISRYASDPMGFTVFGLWTYLGIKLCTLGPTAPPPNS